MWHILGILIQFMFFLFLIGVALLFLVCFVSALVHVIYKVCLYRGRVSGKENWATRLCKEQGWDER